MYCLECGTAVEGHFRFCKECGTGLEPSATAKFQHVVGTGRVEFHFKSLVWLLIGSATLTGLLSTLIFTVGGVMRVIPIPVEMGPGLGMDLSPMVSTAVLILAAGMFAVAGMSVAVGVGILYYQEWGRVMGLVVASLLIFKFPFAAVIDIYAFWVLLSEDGREHFHAHILQHA